MIDVIHTLVLAVGMMMSLSAMLLGVVGIGYCAFVGFCVMVRRELTPSAVREMRVGSMMMPNLMDGMSSGDIAAALEAGDKLSGSLGYQKVGKA